MTIFVRRLRKSAGQQKAEVTVMAEEAPEAAEEVPADVPIAAAAEDSKKIMKKSEKSPCILWICGI